MLLPACRKLDRVAMEISERHRMSFILHGHVVDACTAAPDQSASLAIAADEAGKGEQAERGYASFQLAARHVDAGQRFSRLTFLKCPPRGLSCFSRGIGAMCQACGL